jgi:hypothetical protein
MLRSSQPVMEELAGLINALASGHIGREYLLQPGAGTVPVLHQMLLAPPGEEGGRQGCSDSRLQQQALAALQKLSLHRRAQSEMVAAGVLDWALGWLQVGCCCGACWQKSQLTCIQLCGGYMLAVTLWGCCAGYIWSNSSSLSRMLQAAMHTPTLPKQ